MNDLGKGLVILGLALVVLGGVLWLGDKLPWFGRLPGDIRVEREHFKFTMHQRSGSACQALVHRFIMIWWNWEGSINTGGKPGSNSALKATEEVNAGFSRSITSLMISTTCTGLRVWFSCRLKVRIRLTRSRAR